MASSSSSPKPQRPAKCLNPSAPPFLPENKKNMISERRAMGPTPCRVWRPIEKKLDLHRHNGLGNGKWAPKDEVNKNTEDAGSRSDLKNGVLIDGATTTVMVKNIPNQFRRTSFLRILTSYCSEQNMKAKLESDRKLSEFDFVYLPMDFNKYWCENKINNLGYAFVNFTTAAAAQKFYQRFHNRPWNVRYNRKTCEITCAKIQGKAALIENFKHKIFWCHSKGFMPVVVSPPCDGTLVPRAIPPCRRTMVPRATAVGILGRAPAHRRTGPLASPKACCGSSSSTPEISPRKGFKSDPNMPFAPHALHDYQHLPIIMLFFYPPPPPSSNLPNTGNYLGAHAHHPPGTSRRAEGRLVHRRKYKPKPSSSVVPFPCTSPQQLTTSSATTVTVKNIPNNIGASFLRILKRHCWEENRSRKADDPNNSMFHFSVFTHRFPEDHIKFGLCICELHNSCCSLEILRHFHCRMRNRSCQKSKTCEVTCAKIQA